MGNVLITDKPRTYGYEMALGENSEDITLLNKLTEFIEEGEGSVPNTRWNENAIEDYDFYAGVQDPKSVIDELIAQDRPTSVFNEVKPKIDMLIGMADQVRKEPILLPVGYEDEALAELMNGVFKHFRYLQRTSDKEMECFEHVCKAGKSYLHYYVDANNPFEPEIKCVRTPGRDVVVDPNSIEYDLSDAKYVAISKWFTADEMKQYIPKFDADILTQLYTSAANRPVFFDPGSRLYRLVEMWYTQYENVIWFVNPITGEPDNLEPEKFRELQAQLIDGIEIEEGQTIQMDELEHYEGLVKKIYFCLFSGPYILAKGVSPYRHNHFPIILYGGYKDENRNLWLSPINAMKDPQMMLNTMRRQFAHLLQSSPKGLLMEEVGVIQNREEYQKKSSKPNFILQLARGAINRVKFAEQPQINPIYGQLDAVYTQSMKDSSGIQDSLMGIQQGTREPGVTARQRLESSVAVLYILFSNFRKSRIQSGKIALSMIQQYITKPYVVRVEGEKGMQLMEINTQMNSQSPDFNDASVGKFDLVVDEEAENVTMRRGIAQMLMDMSHNNPNSIPPELIIEYLGLPLTVKNQVQEYNEAMRQQEFALEMAKIEGKNKPKE